MDEKKNNLKTTKPNPQARVIFWLVSIILIVFLGYLTVPNKLGQRRPAYASRAKSTLRSTGSSQEAYREVSNRNSYGTFQDLVNSLYIAEGYSLGNMIENYTMTWEIGSSSVVKTSGPLTMDRFTIIAFPLDTAPRNLHTFAITEDQTVRVYVPEDNDFNSVKTWDPIL